MYSNQPIPPHMQFVGTPPNEGKTAAEKMATGYVRVWYGVLTSNLHPMKDTDPASIYYAGISIQRPWEPVTTQLYDSFLDEKLTPLGLKEAAHRL